MRLSAFAQNIEDGKKPSVVVGETKSCSKRVAGALVLHGCTVSVAHASESDSTKSDVPSENVVRQAHLSLL